MYKFVQWDVNGKEPAFDGLLSVFLLKDMFLPFIIDESWLSICLSIHC